MHYAELCWPDVLRVHEQSRRENVAPRSQATVRAVCHGICCRISVRSRRFRPTEMMANIVASRKLILLAALYAADLTVAMGGRNFQSDSFAAGTRFFA